MNPDQDAQLAVRSWRLEANSGAVGEVRWSAALPVFIGHFPGHPLVPGVHQLAAVAVVARHGLGQPALRLTGVGHAKWLLPVRPDELLGVAVTWTAAGSGWQVHGQITRGDARCVVCRLHLEP
jgi:3-hydroxyacyl-[acyl-carrier-protein] dehydratase